MEEGLTSRIARAARETTRREDGQALVEYGLIVAFIAAVAVGSVLLFGTDVKNLFDTAVGAL